VVPCSDADGYFSAGPNGSWCYYQSAPNGSDPNNPAYAALWVGHTTPPSGGIYLARCYNRQYADSAMAWILQNPTPLWLPTAPPGVTPPVTAVSLAIHALGQLRFTDPAIDYAPRLSASANATVVNAHTWYWTDPGSATPKKPDRTVAGNIWAQIVATPTLTVTPGDDSATVTCADGGTTPPAGTSLQNTPSPSGCEHVYTHTSLNQPNQAYAITYTVAWKITYTGTGVPTPATLATITRTATATLPVIQIQSLVVPGN